MSKLRLQKRGVKLFKVACGPFTEIQKGFIHKEFNNSEKATPIITVA